MHVIYDPAQEEIYVLQRGSNPLPAEFWTLLRMYYSSPEEYQRTCTAWETSRKATPLFIKALLETKKDSYKRDKTCIIDYSIFSVNSKSKDAVSILRDSSGEESIQLNHHAHIIDDLLKQTSNCRDIPMISYNDIFSESQETFNNVKARSAFIITMQKHEFVMFSDSSLTLASTQEIGEFVSGKLDKVVHVVSSMQWSNHYGEWTVKCI